MDQRSDDELVERSRGADAQAFKELVIRHEGKVAGVVQSMLGRTAEAEDVGQEVFVRFYQALEKFRGESLVSTYLIRIAINLSLNEIKKRKKQDVLFKRIEEGHSAKTPDDKADVKEIITYEVSQLDPDDKLVISLRMIEGYSTGETAALLGIPLGTVLSRLFRAQKKLKSALAKYK